jgi:hypothetical protein
VRCDSRFCRYHATRRRLVVSASRAISHCFAAALYQGTKPGLDVPQPSCNQRTVPVVQLATPACGGGALGPAPRQRAFGVTPADQLLQSLELRWMTHVAAQSTALFVNAEDPRDASLPVTSSTFQGCDVVGLEVTVLAIKKRRELVQRLALVVDETTEPLATLRLLHLQISDNWPSVR